MATRRLTVEIIGDASSLNRALGQATTRTSRFGKVAKTALVGGAAAGLFTLQKAARIGWDEYNRGQQVAAQTNAVIKSTGAVANVTAKHVQELGEALMRKSGVDDEVIKSGENVLLTFRGIRNEAGKGNKIFDEATKLTLDLSVAMHKDLNSAAVMVGKALQDPIRGLTALRRVGVQFTREQEDQIKALVESGENMKAQKMILAELRAEFGGSAAAVGQTFGGQLNIARERLNNFLGDMTEKAIPALQSFTKWAGPRVEAILETSQKAIATWRNALNEANAALHRNQNTLQAVGKVISVVVAAVRFAAQAWLFWARVIGTVWVKEIQVAAKVLNVVIGIVKAFGRAGSAAGSAVASAFHAVASAVMAVVNAIRTLIGWFNRIPRSIPVPRLPDPTPGFDIPGVPVFDRGGVIPGRRGSPRLIMAHGGETVLPTHRGARGGGSVQVIVVGGDRGAIEWFQSMMRTYSRQNAGRSFA